jgi:hypothetical protein
MMTRVQRFSSRQAYRKAQAMSFKFAVGQAVEYKPAGAQVGLFRVTRQMPEEFQAIDRKYRIKSDHEDFERNVLECDLEAAVYAESAYAPARRLRRSGGH